VEAFGLNVGAGGGVDIDGSQGEGA